MGGGAIPHPEKETLMSDKINGTEVVTENFCVRNKITFDDVKSFVEPGEIVNTLAEQEILNKGLLDCYLLDASGEGEPVKLSVEDVVKHVTAPVPIPPVSYVTGSFDVAVGGTLDISADKDKLKPPVPNEVKIDPKFLVSALGFYADGTEAGTIAEIVIEVVNGVLTAIRAPAALTDATTVTINILLAIYQVE